jgi:hypothetical protein
MGSTPVLDRREGDWHRRKMRREHEIVIRIRLPNLRTWRSRLLLMAVLLIGASTVAFAVLPMAPPTFADGTTLAAAPLNALSTDVTNLDGRVGALESPARSEILASRVGAGAAAFGTTNTAIFHYADVKKTGAAITMTSDAALGDSFTINQAGIYSVTITGTAPAGMTAAGEVGVSVNAMGADLSKEIGNVPLPYRVVFTLVPSYPARAYPSASAVLSLSAGDVVRPHGNPGGSGDFADTASYSTFRIVKVSN